MRLLTETVLVGTVVNLGVAGGNNHYRTGLKPQRNRLGNALRRAAQGLCRQLHRCA